MKNWTTKNIPSQMGKIVVITGANSGVGFATTEALARKGAKVVMAVRNLEKGKEAKNEILKETPKAQLDLIKLDLADLNSVEKFSSEFHQSYNQLDVLINNAGIYKSKREETAQGFEAHFGVNYLAHFVLTLKLLSSLQKSDDARIVTVSSFIPKLMNSFMNWGDLQFKQNYSAIAAYGQSKLATILFGLKLDRKLKGHQSSIKSIIVNPGFTKSGIKKEMNFLMKVSMKLVAQETDMGMLPSLLAAIDEKVEGGEFLSPNKLKEMRGYPELINPPKQALNIEGQEKLWKISEEMTKVKFSL